jgi:molecular chaperone DnaK
LAYGFQSVQDNVYWLVYDLGGGGTFDTAVIQPRDGLFRLVNHGGDRCLGGKLIDWAIVDQVFVPAVMHQQPLIGLLPAEKRGHLPGYAGTTMA